MGDKTTITSSSSGFKVSRGLFSVKTGSNDVELSYGPGASAGGKIPGTDFTATAKAGAKGYVFSNFLGDKLEFGLGAKTSTKVTIEKGMVASSFNFLTVRGQITIEGTKKVVTEEYIDFFEKTNPGAFAIPRRADRKEFLENIRDWTITTDATITRAVSKLKCNRYPSKGCHHGSTLSSFQRL